METCSSSVVSGGDSLLHQIKYNLSGAIDQAVMLSTIAGTLVFVKIKDSLLTKLLTQIAKQLWSEWELRLLVIGSLVLQFCLVYCGNKRRNYQGNHSVAVAVSAWMTYLSANSVANLVLSTLLQGNPAGPGRGVRNEIVVFWSPFILWHLGSPHNITAYSLEDNDMWLRQFFGLVIQVGEAVYIHMKFRSNSILSFLAVPIFISGVFKAGERIWALRCANEKQIINSLSPDPEEKLRGSEYMDERPSRKGKKLGRRADVDSTVGILYQAHSSFNKLKSLFIDLPVPIAKKEFDKVVEVLKSEPVYDEELGLLEKQVISAEEAFALVGIELSFLYDFLFTKVPLHQNDLKVSLSLHGFSFLSAVTSLIGFAAFVNKPEFKRTDIAISYMLMVGAISLDVYLFITHALSKWTIAKFGNVPGSNKFYSKLVALKLRSIKSKCAIRRVPQHDLISYFVEAYESKFIGAIKLIDTGNLLQKHKYTTWEPVDPNLKTFIYDHLLKKRKEYHNLLKKFGKEDSDSLILTNLLEKDPEDDVFAAKGLAHGDDLKPDKSDFSHCIFVWHIATGLVYYDDYYKHRRDRGGSYSEISKILSDYMLYLVLLRPMMLPKGHGEVINKATSRSAEIFFPQEMRKLVSDDKKQFVTALISYECLIPKSGNSMDVLQEGRMLAKNLQSLVSRDLDDEEKWEMISEVWMGLMIQAANHCLWKEHAQQLRRGGELRTHVALLMAHLGLSTKICILHDDPYPF